MSNDILDPATKLTRSDASMLARLSDPNHEGKRWLAQLSAQHRQAIVGKIIASINALSVSDRNDQKILSRLAMVLARFDALDLDREQGPGGIVNNTQVNIDARGNEALNSLTIEELLAIRDKMRAGGNGKH